MTVNTVHAHTDVWFTTGGPLWCTKPTQRVHITSYSGIEKSKACSPSVDQAFLQVVYTADE